LYQKKYIKDLYENINLYIWQSKILKIQINMTKAELVTKISSNLGLEKNEVLATVEDFMEEVKNSLSEGENVYLRGFGSFIVKRRAEKTGRNISKNITIKIPAHSIPSFKPAKIFVEDVKNNN
jgi:DNA-binding protein HU-beta